jgi:hypothetical protein
MKKIKVLLDFIKLSVAEKIAFYRNIIAKLTDNPTYPTPEVPLTDAKAVVDALEAAFVASRDGSHSAISAMHDNEAAANAVFYKLAAYVEKVAEGDETKILSSGFHESRQPISRQKPQLSAADGANTGSVKLIAKAVDRAGAYIWQSAKESLPVEDSEWVLVATGTRSYHEISGLTVGGKYYFRVAAVTPDGTADFSAPVLKVVV